MSDPPQQAAPSSTESVEFARESASNRIRSSLKRVSGELRASPLSMFGAVLVVVLGFVAVFGPAIVPHDPTTQQLEHRLQGPSVTHPLGTDHLGRDMLSRITYGARFSLAIALAVTAIRVVVGTVVGLVAGYVGGWLDELLMRLVDIQLAFPGLVFALVVAGILGPSLRNVMIALAIVGWTTYARVVRSEVLSIRERKYIEYAQLVGTPRRRLFGRHLLPNVISPVIVIATLNLGTVVLATAGLSFIGLGAQPPTPEWGTMLAEGRSHLRTAPWIVNAPGVAIMCTVLGFNLLGDSLRDALDPRQQTRVEEV